MMLYNPTCYRLLFPQVLQILIQCFFLLFLNKDVVVTAKFRLLIPNAVPVPGCSFVTCALTLCLSFLKVQSTVQEIKTLSL
jgi:hypothetical protein